MASSRCEESGHIEYSRGKPKRVDTVLSPHNTRRMSRRQRSSKRDRRDHYAGAPQGLWITISRFRQPDGAFVWAGPWATRVYGRKIIVIVWRHGSSWRRCVQRKDPHKSGPLAGTRQLCCEEYCGRHSRPRGSAGVLCVGVAHPLSVNVETFGTAKISDENLAVLINEYFDLRPGAIIRDLGLRKPIYQKTAAYGHFGRDDIEFPWERTDKAEALKSAVGL